jgi:hypothetical protein
MVREAGKVRSVDAEKRRWRRGSTAAVSMLIALTILLIAAGSAAAATVSGVLKNGAGIQLILVQANGTAKQATIAKASGAFTIRNAKLAGASLNLVRADGSYLGPIVLKASGAKAYCTIKGSANLKIGTATLKSGYALVKTMPKGRFDTRPAYTAKAVRGKPIGAGKLGRVATGVPGGLRGPGGDLDRDGIVGAFDIDVNGNLILDNIDRTGRGSSQPPASGVPAGPKPPSARASGQAPGPPPPPGNGEIRMYSSFWLIDVTSINANIPGIPDVDELIDQNLPTSLFLQTELVGQGHATLDGLGNSYLREHSVDDVTYPLVNPRGPGTFDREPATFTNGLLDIADASHRVCIWPGAQVAEIGSGDAYVETAQDGTQYPGSVNFVFNTAPALKSYQFNTDAAATEGVYDADGVRPEGDLLFTVPTGASSVTLTFWRPQRKAVPGETASVGGWVDMGGLWYGLECVPPRDTSSGDLVGTSDVSVAISNGVANGVPVAPSLWQGGVLDPAADAPANPANTISFTLDMAKCYSSWATLDSGTSLQIGLKASGAYGDDASVGLWFELE